MEGAGMTVLIVAGSALYVWLLFGPLLRQHRRSQRPIDGDD